MPRFATPATIMPMYSRAPAIPSLLRRAMVLVLQLIAAAVYGVAAVALPPELGYIMMLPIAVCIFLALWMMPDRHIFPTHTIESGFKILFVLMAVWPEYIAIVLPGLPWLTPTRIVLFLVTFVFIYSIATSSELRRHLSAVATQSKLLWAGFIMWQIAMFITLPLSNHVGQSLKLLVDRQLSYSQSLFLGCLIFAKRGNATWTIACFIILAVVCSVDGFVELRMGHPPWALHIPTFLNVDAKFLENVLGSQARAADGLYRVRGPFVNSLVCAEFLALSVPFILHWMLTGKSITLRISMFLTLILVISAIVVTHSRLGLVGTFVALGVYVPMWAFRVWRSDRTSMVGPTILFGAPVIAFGLMAVVFSSHRLAMTVLGGGAQQSSNDERNEQRRAALPLILHNPIGYGLGQGAVKLDFHAPDGTLSIDDNTLSTTLDLGVLGLVGYYGMFIVGASLSIRPYFSVRDRENELSGPLATALIVFLVVRYVLAEEFNHPLAFFLLGMAMALRAREKGIGGLDSLFRNGEHSKVV